MIGSITEWVLPIRGGRGIWVKDMHKTLLRVWLVLWVVTLPLVHIHPEADHAHGISDHVHGGTYHSILVNTPVHAHQGFEQEEHHHDGFFSPENHHRSKENSSHPFHGFEETSYGFSVIKPTLDPDSDKSEISHGLVVEVVSSSAYASGRSKSPNFLKHQHFSTLPHNLSPRAPPVLFI